MKFHTIEEAIADIKKGKMIILSDDEDRENEGDLVIAAEKVTPEVINFMAKYGRGLICLTLTEERTEQLQLAPMAQENTSSFGTAFTISIDARKDVSTGISAKDRAVTILTAIHPDTRPGDLVRPGHIFPIRAQKGEC
ncbi:MAG: 3,4-dihydroxy-2-butanone-4-phosphate synthase [Candidatus Manganitrophus sp.]|nr:MAG: 3,4-dihydroxy-2-butanone-4-phosphate synthase [Candidatus Manganitrophus sp.]